MNSKAKILTIGVLLLTAGIFTALVSFAPSQVLQYIFIGVTLSVGVLGLSISRQAKKNFVRSKYYTWIGFTLFALAISLGIWAMTLTAFISVLGFFLLLLGIIEFVFAQQILYYEESIPWKLVATKLIISTITATGSVWILTMADVDANIALLFLGVLVALVGLAFIQVSRIAKQMEQSVETTGNGSR